MFRVVTRYETAGFRFDAWKFHVKALFVMKSTIWILTDESRIGIHTMDSTAMPVQAREYPPRKSIGPEA